MDRKLVAVACLAIVFIISTSIAPLASAAPPEPDNFFGVARESDGSTLIALGTQITAFIDGVDYSNGTSVSDASGHYDANVYGNWVTQTGQPNTPEVKEGGDLNDPIMFVAGDMTTAGSVFTAQRPWTPAGSENLDLTLAAAQPALLKVARVTTRPADGRTQYLYVCNPTPSAVDLTTYFIQKDGTGTLLGPRHSLAGAQPLVVAPGRMSYVNLTSWDVGGTTLAPTGDALKLAWDNPGGAGFGGSDIVIDRVEYNQTSGGTMYQLGEPTNTIMSDAAAPSSPGLEIRRNATCGDTNNNAVDFSIGPETGRPGAPLVTLTVPDGGEIWAGYSQHDIGWTMTDPDTPWNLTADLAYSTDSGATYPNLIAAGLSRAQGPSTYLWTVPCMNSTTVRVRVTAYDGPLSASHASAADFTIACRRPVVTNVVPSDGAVDVPLFQSIEITFSENMARIPTQGAVGISPQPVTGIVHSWPAPAGYVLSISHNEFATCTLYTVTVATTARDVLGDTMADPFEWSFFTRCAPTATISAPVGGEVWSGGSVHDVVFTTADTDANLSILLEVWDGSIWRPGFGPGDLPTGPRTLPTTIPDADTTSAYVRVRAMDSTFMYGYASSPFFAIDGTAPRVLSSVPAGSAVDVDPTANFAITFSEAMHQASTNLSIGLSPAAGVLTLTWSPAGTSLTIAHGPLTRGQSYTLTVSTTARDLSDPGNALSPAYSATFTVVSPVQLEADAGPDQTGAAGGTLSFDGGGSTPATLITSYRWEFVDPDGASTFHSGKTTTFTFTEVGVWHVILNVSDNAGNFDTDEALVTISERQGQDFLGAYGWLIAILIVAIVGAVLFFLFYRRRKEKEGGPAPAPVTKSAPAQPPSAAEGAEPETKECPKCGTVVDATATECAMCGERL